MPSWIMQYMVNIMMFCFYRTFIVDRFFWQEEATREDANRILLFKEINDKEKSISILL